MTSFLKTRNAVRNMNCSKNFSLKLQKCTGNANSVKDNGGIENLTLLSTYTPQKNYKI